MKKILFISLSLCVFVACTKKASPTSSAAAVSVADKAKAEAMYNSDIKPVIEAKCSPCHFPDKGGQKASLNSFDAVSKNIDDVLRRVQLDPGAHGFMPFKSKKEPLTAAEIASLKAWKEVLPKQ